MVVISDDNPAWTRSQSLTEGKGIRMAPQTGKRLSTLPRPTQEHLIRINDFDLYCREYGQGLPLLLLHGFFGTNEIWEPYIGAFARHYRLVIPDLRGHGRSTNPSDAYTECQSALDMYALLDQLGIEQFRGIGFSSGAMTLIHMATQQPMRVDAMVLIDGTFTYTEESRAIHRGMTMDTIDPQFLDLLRSWHTRGEDQVRSLVNQFHRFHHSTDDMDFAPSSLSKITARTLIVHGDRDEFFPVSIALQMYHAIPRSFLWVVPNGSHVLFFKVFGGTAPGDDIFPGVALDFLRGEWESNQ
jgi:pimeloyl-ACP methyl ester carboxylesterase